MQSEIGAQSVANARHRSRGQETDRLSPDYCECRSYVLSGSEGVGTLLVYLQIERGQ